MVDLKPAIGVSQSFAFNTVLFIALLLASGCATPMSKFELARESFVSGDLVKSHESLSGLAKSRRGFADAAALDLAMVELARGEARSAEERFRKLRDQFENQAKIAPIHEAAALITDDTARAFRPADYEKVMIRAMLVVCSLASDGADAESYALQAAMLQAELAEDAQERGVPNAKSVYQPIAFAPYMRGILREATHHDYDDAARSYELVTSVQPSFAPAHADVVRASVGAHSAPGHGVLYVIACVGRGPVLEEVDAPTTSSAMQIASSVLNVQTNQTKESAALALPNIASVKVPRVKIPFSRVVAVGVRDEGVGIGVTQTLTHVGELAVNQNDAEMPWTIARAVVRRATKETTVAATGKTLGLDGALGSLFHFAAASAWSSVEHADTRCWSLLPREIQVLRVELPSGEHNLKLNSLGSDGREIGAGITKRVSMIDGKNEYLIVIVPDQTIYQVN